MKHKRLLEIIEEEIYNAIKERSLNKSMLREKSVPEPYDRKVGSPGPKPRRMTSSQTKKRDKIGKAMENNPKVVAKYKKKHDASWKDYLWATATNIALRGE
jgi:hypothetical protein